MGSLHFWWPRPVAVVEPPVLYLQSTVPTAACDMAIVFRPIGYSSLTRRVLPLRSNEWLPEGCTSRYRQSSRPTHSIRPAMPGTWPARYTNTGRWGTSSRSQLSEICISEIPSEAPGLARKLTRSQCDRAVLALV
jgi:hypothetical protein